MSSYNKSSARSIVPQKLKNVFLEEVPVVGGMRYDAYSCPGFSEWIDFSSGYGRGGFVHNDTLYVVYGTSVYTVDTAGTYVSIGTIDAPVDTGHAKVSIAATNDDITICNGSKAWNYKISTSTFAQVTDGDLPATDTILRVVAYGDYTLYIIQDSQTVFVSDVGDATSVNALSFFSAESFFDNIISGAVAQNYLYLFGTTTTEIWYNSGGTTVPFDKTSQGALSYGLIAPEAIAVINNEMYFLAKDQNGPIGLMKFSGTSPVILMNRSLNERLRTYTAIDDAYFWVDVHNGHQFLNITFPSATTTRSETHTYDITTDKWLERETWNSMAKVSAGYEGHPAQFCVYFNNKQYFGSRFDATLNELSMDVYADGTYAMVREIITPYILTEEQWFSVYSLEVDVERSIALSTGQGSDPMIDLYITTDRQGTWQGAFTRSVGQIGDYNARTLWQSCGGGRSMAFKLSFSDPVPWVIHGITAEIRGQITVPPRSA